MRILLPLASFLFSVSLGSAQIPVLKASDVVFMYGAGKEVYQDYGATVLAWGGTPKPAELAEASGLKYFGSVGMVTEFNRYHERFPDTYEQGLCRDLKGQPYKVPWLTDQQHKGVPYWWCCTRQPLFRQYISERVVETVKAGAYGVHIDDHLGTAGSLWPDGGCFCDRCVDEFRSYLKDLSREELAGVSVEKAKTFNLRDTLCGWITEKSGRTVQQHPLWSHWRVYQLRGAAQFMGELRELAARTASRPVPLSANACLLWGPHLNDYKALDFFSAEIEHRAGLKRFSDEPILAYRIADTVNRPLASTGSGGDWAFIKKEGLHGLVQGWIALGYAAGNSLMAPHHQWCYTKERGTHWYDGPRDKFAPLYRFPHDHPALFDGFKAYADVIVAYAQRTFDRDPRKVVDTCSSLSAAGLSYTVAMGGDKVFDHALGTLPEGKPILILEPNDFLASDRAMLDKLSKELAFTDVTPLLAATVPAAKRDPAKHVRLFPRVKPGAAVIHLLNWNYRAEQDGVEPVTQLQVKLNLRDLGISSANHASLHVPGTASMDLEMTKGEVTVPELGLWGVLELKQANP